VLTPGQQHDVTAVDELLANVPERPVEAAIMDKAYDSDEIRKKLEEKHIKPVIPERSNRKEKKGHDKQQYRERNRVERLINRLKHFRAVATRYEKLSCTFLAIVQLVATLVITR
jgi:transposase